MKSLEEELREFNTETEHRRYKLMLDWVEREKRIFGTGDDALEEEYGKRLAYLLENRPKDVSYEKAADDICTAVGIELPPPGYRSMGIPENMFPEWAAERLRGKNNYTEYEPEPHAHGCLTELKDLGMTVLGYIGIGLLILAFQAVASGLMYCAERATEQRLEEMERIEDGSTDQ